MVNLIYGKQLESDFLDAGEAIAEDVDVGKFFGVSKILNDAFFGGGVLAPKSFATLSPINYPTSPSFRDCSNSDRKPRVTIEKGVSFSAAIGYVEGIPVIGSAIAVIQAISHLFGMLSSYLALKNEVRELHKMERTDFNVGRGACCNHATKVFDAAMSYTMHQNHLVGSLISIIPLLKPVTRLAQGVIFNLRANGGISAQV